MTSFDFGRLSAFSCASRGAGAASHRWSGAAPGGSLEAFDYYSPVLPFICF